MDELSKYQTIIKELLKDYMEQHQTSSHDSEVETLLVTDDEHGQYLVIKNGWQGKDRVQLIPIFLRLVDGKIWVEEDWTDYEVVDRLLEAGIPQEQIVLAFHHPSMRQFSEFGTPYQEKASQLKLS
jgi:hypothetical protein